MVDNNGQPTITRSEVAWVNQTFPTKLYALLKTSETAGFAHIVSWLPHGRSFRVHDRGEFSERILPRYFHSKCFASFQRQCNIYGFKRVGTGADKHAYYHKDFLRGCPTSSTSLKRQKLKGKGPRKPTEASPDFYNKKWMPPLGNASQYPTGYQVGMSPLVTSLPYPLVANNVNLPSMPIANQINDNNGSNHAGSSRAIQELRSETLAPQVPHQAVNQVSHQAVNHGYTLEHPTGLYYITTNHAVDHAVVQHDFVVGYIAANSGIPASYPQVMNQGFQTDSTLQRRMGQAFEAEQSVSNNVIPAAAPLEMNEDANPVSWAEPVEPACPSEVNQAAIDRNTADDPRVQNFCAEQSIYNGISAAFASTVEHSIGQQDFAISNAGQHDEDGLVEDFGMMLSCSSPMTTVRDMSEDNDDWEPTPL